MITHDCLNIFIKNLTVILISSLYLTKFIISTFAKKCVIRPNLYEKWAHVRKSKYQFIHDIRLATWWCMVLFNFQHFKIDGFHSVHGPFSMTLTFNEFPFSLNRSRNSKGLQNEGVYTTYLECMGAIGKELSDLISNSTVCQSSMEIDVFLAILHCYLTT